MFDETGRVIYVDDPIHRVDANPFSINVLPEFRSDPRTADKVFDGVCKTCDDFHMWLAPFSGFGEPHILSVSFDSPLRLSAIRIWVSSRFRAFVIRFGFFSSGSS